MEQSANNQGVVFKRKEDEDMCLVGRDGDNLMQPFQYDLYWCRNLQLRNPVESNRMDQRLLIYIRRVNMDMLWIRVSGTVCTTLSTHNNSFKA